MTSLKHDALTSFARGMRCKRIALARFPQHVGCREFLARNMRPPQSALSQHYSQHSVNTTVNTAKTLQLTAFRGIYTFLSIKRRILAFFDENLEMPGFSNVLAVLTVVLTVVLTEC